MALDKEKMRRKLQELENQENKTGSRKSTGNFWSPSAGDHTIRIVDGPDGDPFFSFHLHYNLGDQYRGGVLCPKHEFGEKCPVCEYGTELWRSGEEYARQMAKKYFASQRFFSAILIRGEEEEGIKWWGYSKTVYKDLLGLTLNPEYDDIVDLEKGTDLNITYVPGDRKANTFAKTTIVPSRRDSPLLDDPEKVQALMDSLPKLETLMKRKTPDELAAILGSHLDPTGNTIDPEVQKPSGVDEALMELSA